MSQGAEQREAEQESLAKVAETYVSEASASLKSGSPSYLAAVIHLQKAIEAYRRIGRKSRAEELHRMLLDYESKSVKELKHVSVKMDASDKIKESITAAVDAVKGKLLKQPSSNWL